MRPEGSRGWISLGLAAWLACATTAPPPDGSDAPGAASLGLSPGTLALPAPASAPPGRVLLVSIAGLTPEAYAATTDRPPLMPTLAALAQAGVYSDRVAPDAAASRYPAHATLVTGRTAISHGIVSDRMLADNGIQATPYWLASQLEGLSLWQAETAAGGRVVALDWPTTVGASIEIVLPDLIPLHPGETWLAVVRQGTSPWLFERIEPRMPAGADRRWPNRIERDTLLVDLACDTTRLSPTPSLWLLSLAAPIEALWRAGPETGASREALARADAELRRLLGCFSSAGLLDQMAVVVVGDQAWQPVHTRIDPNVFLQDAGLVARDPRTRTGVRAWKAIARSNGGSAFVYAKDEYSALLALELLREQAAWTGAFRVISASEMKRLGTDPEAWFGLEAGPGYTFGNRIRGSEALSASVLRATGGYFDPATKASIGMVAWGGGLRRGVRIPILPAVDIAPTVAALLEIDLPDAEGRPLVGALSFDPYQHQRHRRNREMAKP